MKRNYAVDAKIGMLERLSFTSGNIGNCIGLAIISMYMMYYYTDVLAISATAIATIMLISRVFDGVTDIFMGYIVDHTHSPKGKARVWLLRGALPYMLSVVGIFFVPSGASDMVKYVYIFVMYNLANAVFGTVINTSYNSMNSLITKNATETGILGIFGMVGAMAGTNMVGAYALKLIHLFGEDERAWHIGIAIIGLIGLAFLMLCYAGVRERVVESQKQAENPLPIDVIIKNLLNNKYWLMVGVSYILIMFFNGIYSTSLLYYCKGVLGNSDYMTSIMNMTAMPQILATISALYFVKKFGKGNTFRMGNVILVAGFVIRAFAPVNPTVQIVCGLFYGIGYGLATSEILGMLADTVEFGYWQNKVRIVGSAFAVMSFAAKIGNGLGSSVVGWLLDWSGYNGAATVQTASATTAITACSIYIPLVATVVMLVLMNFYNLDKRFAQIVADNKAREQADMEVTD